MQKKLVDFLSRARALYERNETRLGLLFMASGFVFDSLTLHRLDLPFENAVFASYLALALFVILFLNAYYGGQIRSRLLDYIHPWATLPMQFAFGGLFSGYIIFYSRSASLIASWPFLIVLAALLIGNEFSRDKYARLVYQVSVFSVALYSFMIFFVPVLTKQMSAGMFLLSGAVSLVVVTGVCFLIRAIARERFEHSKRYLIAAIVTIFAVFNLLYFTNILPPIPLSLKSAGLYHSVERRNGGFVVTKESAPWYRFYDETSRVYRRSSGEPVYVVTSVFAPTELRVNIFHQWQEYDPETDSWIDRDRLSFSIVGGRDGGYRGYSRKSAVAPGRWRVKVITDRGQVLGQISFMINQVSEKPALVEETI